MGETPNNSKKMMWTTLATMAFSIVWSFGNVVNGFIYFDGTKVIFSWIIIFLLFFIPYALMDLNWPIMLVGHSGQYMWFIFPVKVQRA